METENEDQDSIVMEHQLNNQEFEESDVNLLHESNDFENIDENDNQIRKEPNNDFNQNYVGKSNQQCLASSSSSKKKKMKNKSNSFSLGRTCFRGMSNYYKDKFEPILKQWEKDLEQRSSIQMDDLVTQFIKSEFEFAEEFY
jgi:ABC-type proline/glycine betaine transport system ATPase subunit